MKTPVEKNLYTSNADRQFHVNEMIDWDELGNYADVDKELFDDLLTEAGKLIGKEIAVRSVETEKGDFSIDNGNLVWPQSIKDSYKNLVDSDLVCMTVSSDYGGSELPYLVQTMIGEQLFQADPGFATIPLLQSGVAEMIETFGSDELKKKYLPRMTSGEYTGCMDLTEPNAGSDLGNIRTKAVEIDGETYIVGSKCFITNGGADIHLVLARDADTYSQTMGKTKGISLYLVPQEIDGESNNVSVTGLEHKLGIHSSPTCSVSYDEVDGKGARGYLLGQKGKGLKCMFTLMNNARLGVASQGLGTLEAALSDALAYAEEREQGKKAIIEYGMVKEMLADMQMSAEAIRSLVYSAAFSVDMQHALKKTLLTADASEKPKLEAKLAEHANRAAVLTPLAKFYGAEKAIEHARNGVQVHGGAGYTQDQNAEKHLRDSLIIAIYEGTSEIQAGLFLANAIEDSISGGHARANVSKLLSEIKTWQNSSSADQGSQYMLSEMCEMIEHGIEFATDYIKDTLPTHPPRGDTDTAQLYAKPLAYMVAETLAGYELLKQSEKNKRKEVVAHTFLDAAHKRAQTSMFQIYLAGPHTMNAYDTILGRDD